MKRPDYNIQIKSQDNGSIDVQAHVTYWPARDGELPESFKELSPEERNRIIEAYIRRNEEVQHRTNVMVQGLMIFAQSLVQKRPEAPDNVVRGPWKGPSELKCTHPDCPHKVTDTFGGYPFCGLHYAEAYDTFVREEERDKNAAAERAAREHAEEHAPGSELDEDEERIFTEDEEDREDPHT